MTPQAVLQDVYGFDQFRPGQAETINLVMKGQNALAVMPTGGGKSLCYQIPALIQDGVTLVVSPLISLMKDQVDSLKQNGIAAAAINSSTLLDEVNPILRSAYEGHTKLLYVAPERLSNEYFQYQLSFLNIQLVAIDEAHCISQWGHDFRPAYRQLKGIIDKLPSHPSILALTATATPPVRQDIGHQLGIPVENFVITSFVRPNISFRVAHSSLSPRRYAAKYLSAHAGEAGIIYANTRKKVDALVDYLQQRGFKVEAYHAGMDSEQRSRVQDDFQFDRVPVIVATNAFGMGIDKSNVRFVLHVNSAKNMEAYYQEAGRAGRDGLPSEAVMLFHASDMQQYRWFVDQSTADDQYKERQYEKLQAVNEYAHTQRCLQQVIVEYFGQECQPCGHCSNCLDDRPEEDITDLVRPILGLVQELDWHYGKSVLAQILTGSTNQRMQQLHADELTHFAALKSSSQAKVVGLIDYLIAAGYLQLAGGQFPTVEMTPKGQQVLDQDEHVSRRMESQPDKRTVQVVADTPEQAALFDKLRQRRWQLAQEQGVPAFMIFSDKTLHEMARDQPQSPAAMLDVSGVGRRKMSQYGQAMIETIQAYLAGAD